MISTIGYNDYVHEWNGALHHLEALIMTFFNRMKVKTIELTCDFYSLKKESNCLTQDKY